MIPHMASVLKCFLVSDILYWVDFMVVFVVAICVFSALVEIKVDL